MSPWTVLIIVVVALVVALLVVVAYGAWRWARSTRELAARLDAAAVVPATTRFDSRELEGLPPVVQRYFRAVLPEGAPIVRATTIEHHGTFNMTEEGERWLPFTSWQRIVTNRPGFVWDARIRMTPALAVHVHDAYVAGEGILHAAILGLVTVMDLRGAGDLAQGELMRFFAEAAWYPTALLPSQGIRWEANDGHSARATLVDGPHGVTLTFTFDADGLIDCVRAEARPRTVSGRVVPTPWEGRWSNYERRGAMLVPMTGEVAWLLPRERKTYWRGSVTELRYEFAE